jgi:hypothetical protein
MEDGLVFPSFRILGVWLVTICQLSVVFRSLCDRTLLHRSPSSTDCFAVNVKSVAAGGSLLLLLLLLLAFLWI